MTIYAVFYTFSAFLRLVSAAILVYWLLTSILRLNNRFVQILAKFVYPFVRPFQRPAMWLMRRTGIPLDFTLWFSMLALQLAGYLLERIYVWVFFSRGLF